MNTLLLEVKDGKSQYTDYYNPVLDDCKAYPRTTKGFVRAVKKLIKTAEIYGWKDYRISIYEGKKEYYNNKPFLGYVCIEKMRRMKLL